MKQCMKELAFDLLQRGDSMRERKAEHPGYTVNLSQILGWTAGRKTRSDAKRMPPPSETTTQVQELSRLEELRERQKKAPWLLGGLLGSNPKRRGKATAWLRFIYSLRTMRCGTRYDRLPVPERTWKKEGGLPQAIPCTSLHETIQIGLNMFGLVWVVDTNILLLIDLTADKSPDLHPTFPRGIVRSPVSFTAIP